MLREDSDGQKTGEISFLIGNDVECVSVLGPNWEFYRIGDDLFLW